MELSDPGWPAHMRGRASATEPHTPTAAIGIRTSVRSQDSTMWAPPSAVSNAIVN